MFYPIVPISRSVFLWGTMPRTVQAPKPVIFYFRYLGKALSWICTVLLEIAKH